jgi:uncharacterized protein YdhG (YjbR/CyaY superfamily)
MRGARTARPNIDQYIDDFPPEVRRTLQKLRLTIRKAAPGATEAIRYRIPTFVLEGNLVHFAAFRSHIGFYPTSSGIQKFEEELTDYEISKGTVRFPLDRPLPLGLITRIVRFRVKENRERAKAKRS